MKDAISPADSRDSLAADLARILENTRTQLDEEFRRRLESAVLEAGTAAMKVAENDREQALAEERARLSAELQGQFDKTLEINNSNLHTEFEQKMSAAAKQWESQKERLEEELKVWRAYADAQRQMAESRSQAEILGHFLDSAEGFAPNLAVYVAKADGLALWKTRGKGSFPDLVSKETIDPEAYFKPIVVREKVVAAVCARQPLKTESVDFLAAALSRAIEAFGMKLQNRTAAAVS